LSIPSAETPQVVDDGGGSFADADGHRLLGMRERVELWGGELTVGPGRMGGFRVLALLPYGEGA
jgi:signal transduction histidine kinase